MSFQSEVWESDKDVLACDLMRDALNAQFNFFIGIDQTGAARLGGAEAKPLPVAFVDARGSRARLVASVAGRPLKLEHFSREAIETLLGAALVQSISSSAAPSPQSILSSSSTALLVDSVFGLPSLAWPQGQRAGAITLRDLFREAAKDTHDRRGYGLRAAAEFFASVLRRSKSSSASASTTTVPLPSLKYPSRACEHLAGANSVFRTQPYQKNIQCGTYRIWRDLGRFGSEWVHLRYFEEFNEADPLVTNGTVFSRPFLFEAYPSLLWRDVLKLRTRDRTKVRAALCDFGDVSMTDEDVLLIERDADHADACILALGGYWLAKQNSLIDGAHSRDRTLAREGWIAGLPRS